MDNDAFKAAQERRMADAFVQSLPANLQALWANHRHTGRFFLYQFDAVTVHERVTDTKTERIDCWLPEACSISFDHGLELELRNPDGQVCRVSHYPRLLGKHPVFVWIPPYLSDTRYLMTHRHGYQLSLNLAFRSRHAPGIQAEGNVFVQKN